MGERRGIDTSQEPALPTESFPQSVAAADMDADGDLDIVCGNASSNNLTFFFQEPLRTFTPQLTVATGISPRSIVAADMDGDRDLDLVCINGNHNVSLFFQEGRGEFTVQSFAIEFPLSVAAADLDGDGDVDLVCGHAFNSMTVLYQDAPRTFRVQPSFAVGRNPRSVTVSDLDGDGDVDLVCANTQSDSLSVSFGRSR